ncbi:UNVERIFIED_CONTAM: Retrovirus-related Pol polyprotein from transposon TNT 1-94 [Sesamum radiatum]|uniref:Retrovirus-related Pol polyprotein from transposon TNT 1-94 n=1 Tax=Sesamum radiatum TaxID=300843 RepID=A0AAW2MCU5_SESRA
MSKHVDDMLIFGSNLQVINETKRFLCSQFDMNDLGETDVILGVKIRKTDNGFSLCQSHYIEKVLKRFNCHDEIPVRTPYDPSICFRKNNGDIVSQAEYAKIVGSIMFLMNYTRPNIAYAISILIRYTHNPNKEHRDTLRRLLRYLKGQEAEWLRNLVGDIPLWGSFVPVSLRCDSQTAIGIVKNYAYNDKGRHICIRLVAVKELLKNGIISLDYMRSERNLADSLTKGLTTRIILETSRAMGLKPLQ